MWEEHGVDGKEDPREYNKTKVLGLEVLNPMKNKVCSTTLC
jgi:hypothetical protein